MFCGYYPFEDRALSFFAVPGDDPIMAFDNLLCYSKSYACAFEAILGVQSLEQLEDVFGKFFLKANAIIFHRKPVVVAIGVRETVEGPVVDPCSFQPYNRGDTWFCKLE